jgi:hypothetical protein
MTYKELIKNLSSMSDDALSKDVTVFVVSEGEYFGLRDDYPLPMGLSGIDNDVLDPGTPYLIV